MAASEGARQPGYSRRKALGTHQGVGPRRSGCCGCWRRRVLAGGAPSFFRLHCELGVNLDGGRTRYLVRVEMRMLSGTAGQQHNIDVGGLPADSSPATIMISVDALAISSLEMGKSRSKSLLGLLNGLQLHNPRLGQNPLATSWLGCS